MAEEQKNTPRTFKWGDSEYLVDDLLKLHTQQEQNYYNFAKDKGQYDEEALQGLRTAIQDRISKVKSGEHFEADGVLASDQVNNIQIQTQKKGLFKKDKYVAQDNTEWAKYYVNKLVNKLTPVNQKKQSSGYDNTKHGLETYLTAQGLDPQDIFSNMDKGDGTSNRLFAERDAIIVPALNNYLQYVKSKNFDFANDDNDFNDNYIVELEDFVKNYNTLTPSQKLAGLNKFGAGKAFATAFTSDKYDLSKSNEEIQAEKKANEEKAKQEEHSKKWQAEVDKQYQIYQSSNPRSAQAQQFLGVDKNFEVTDEDLEAYLSKHPIVNELGEKQYWDITDAAYMKNPYDPYYAQIILPLKAKQGKLGTINNGNYNGWFYDPATVDDTRQSILAIDPNSGRIEEIFLGNIPEIWNKIKQKFDLDNGYTSASSQFYKEGGKFQTGGTLSSYDFIQQWKNEKNKERAAATGNTEEVQKARDRVVSNGDDSFVSEQKTLAQPNAGFTGAEYARLASIAADITSMFLDPITGTAVGLGSSLTNFGADIADDGFQWSDVKNLGINVGFDLLGAIPIFGDAVGTGGKIIKNLTKWAPRVMAGLAGFQGISNFGGMMDSWNKILSEDKDKKLTVQDWRNIAQSISLLTGGVRAVKNKANQSKIKKEAKVEGVVGVNIKDKNGQIQQVLVDGDIAKNIKAAGGNKQTIETELSKLEQFKDKFGANGQFEVNTASSFSFKPIARTTKTNGKKGWEYTGFKKEGRADVYDIYDFNKLTSKNALMDKYHNFIYKVNNTPAIKDRTNITITDTRGSRTNTPENANISEVQQLQNTINTKLTESKTKVSEKSDLIKNLIKRRRELESKENLTQEEIKELRQVRAKIIGNRQAYKGYRTSVGKTTELQKKLQQELTTQQQNSPNTQPQMNQVIQDIKQQLGIRKQGGVIDVNKLNKFLNYGKR